MCRYEMLSKSRVLHIPPGKSCVMQILPCKHVDCSDNKNLGSICSQ